MDNDSPEHDWSPSRWRCLLLPPLVLLSILGASLACPTSTRAGGFFAPDSARIARLSFELEQFNDIRVATRGGRVSVHDLDVEPGGLQFNSGSRGWGISPPQQLLQVVPWGEIESVQARRNDSSSAVLLGAVAGLALGAVFMLGEAQSNAYVFSRTKEISATPLLVGLFGGAALGYAVGRPRAWQLIYP